MSTEKIREEFEAWYRKRYGERDMSQTLELAKFRDAFEVWRASRSSIEIQLPPLSGMDSSFVADGIHKTREHNRYNAAVNDCRKSIESLGLKIKQ